MRSGDTIGKYRLVEPLARGGMGEVWLATAIGHGGFAKNVVLKTLLPELAGEPLFVQMLANEARIGAKLSHPNLVEVFDFIAHDDVYLLAMEYVVGRPLHHVLQQARKRRRHIPIGFTLRVALDCCRGLEYAHDQGIIHCDLSPSNVMIASAGVCKLLDFGVAHASAHGPRADRLKGKFSYMAPERIESLATDRRTDVYSLGVMLYLMLTGQLPFVADSDAQLLRRIVSEAPIPPSRWHDVDPRVEQIVLRAMQPDPAARHQTIREVLAALVPCGAVLGMFSHEAMASYITDLFADRSHADEITHEESDVELASIDVDLGSELSLPREDARPLRRPAQRLPSAIFAAGSETRETRTSVQSLFERPTGLAPIAFAPSEVDPDTLEPSRVVEPVSALWEPRRRNAPLDWMSRAGRPRVERDRPSAESEPRWPWPTSRLKS